MSANMLADLFARVKRYILLSSIIRLHRMYEMLTILTDVRGVCLSASLSVRLSVTQLKSAAAHAVYTESFSAALSND